MPPSEQPAHDLASQANDRAVDEERERPIFVRPFALVCVCLNRVKMNPHEGDRAVLRCSCGMAWEVKWRCP